MHPLLENYFKLIKKFIPSKPEGSAVGLDIGTGECKLIELIKTKESYKILNWAVEPIRSGDVKTSIQNIIATLKNPYKEVFTSVAGRGTLIRYITMPKMTLDDLRNSFSIEADKYFPFSQDQIYTDCYILGENDKTRQMSVIAAAAKKEIIEQRVKLLGDLNIPVHFIGVDSIAIANVLRIYQNKDKEDKKTVAILDMGESVSSLIILDNNLPLFTRDILIGGKDFTKRISNTLGINFNEAEQLKVNPVTKSAEISSSCESTIMNLIQELRLSLDYFTTEKNKEINKFLLTGQGSLFSDIVELIEKSLEVKVEKWNPLQSLELDSSISKEEIDKNSLKLGVALGLALYNYD